MRNLTLGTAALTLLLTITTSTPALAAPATAVDAVITVDDSFSADDLTESQVIAEISDADDVAAWQFELADGYSLGNVNAKQSTAQIVGPNKSVLLALPIALDAAGQPVTISTSQDDNVLKASLTATNDAIAYPVAVFLGADAATSFTMDYLRDSTTTSADAAYRPAKVNVPADYIYDPSLGTLHDYCTYSLDGYYRADFRGPCARHDMCYEEFETNDDRMANCQTPFHNNLRTNCYHAYYRKWQNLSKRSCYAVASAYHWAVVKWLENKAS